VGQTKSKVRLNWLTKWPLSVSIWWRLFCALTWLFSSDSHCLYMYIHMQNWHAISRRQGSYFLIFGELSREWPFSLATNFPCARENGWPTDEVVHWENILCIDIYILLLKGRKFIYIYVCVFDTYYLDKYVIQICDLSVICLTSLGANIHWVYTDNLKSNVKL